MIRALLEGQSAAAVFPTGAGKSLCYQLTALLLDGVTVVVSPLLALMKDQVDALRERDIPAARLDSSLSADEYRQVLAQARSGALKLLYVSPERFNNERFREGLKRLHVSMFVVDEAHCVSEWGHNFRPDYLKLARYARMSKAERVLALTATATPKVLEDIERTFDITASVRTRFHRPNLFLNVARADSPEAKLEKLCRALVPGPAIVYVTLQKTAEEIAGALKERGFPAVPYHAGLPNEERVATQEHFLGSHDCVIVATIAFGMGIDKPDIRGVYHYDPPKSLENYSQEIGRAGRDGATATCHLFFHQPDCIPLQNFVYGDTPTLASLESLVEELFSLGSEFRLSIRELSEKHDLRPLVLHTLLTYLELEGYLQALTPIYTAYRFKPEVSSRELLAHFEGEQRAFLTEVLKRSQKKRTWFDLDLDQTAADLSCPREKVVNALERCSDGGWMELQATQLRFRFRKLKDPESPQGLSAAMHQSALQREKGELERLEQVRELVFSQDCLAKRLAAHFGEELEEDCGVCSVCAGESLTVQAEQPARFELGALPEGLDPRTAARFLCGMNSPGMRKAGLMKHPRFGKLGWVPFAQVLERLQSELEPTHG